MELSIMQPPSVRMLTGSLSWCITCTAANVVVLVVVSIIHIEWTTLLYGTD